MKPFSIENAYLWAQTFILREWRLILPVALAFMALPTLVFSLFPPKAMQIFSDPALMTKDPAVAMNALLQIAPFQIIILIFTAAGGLAITAIALLPGISVAEALTVAARRLWVLICSLLLLVIGQTLLLLLVLVALVFARLPMLTLQSLTLGLILGLGLFVVVRLVPLVPMIVSRKIGPVSAVRESWAMTAGIFWRVFAAVLVYFVGALVVVMALTTGVGAILLLLGKAIGSPELGAALNAIFICTLGAVARSGYYLLVAAIFRQLDGSTKGI